jgi:cyclophilin family peptidyl-prolyl cis-trans isomerase
MIFRSTTGAVVFAGMLAAAVTVFTEQAKPSAALSNPAALKEQAPATFAANFDTSAGPFTITVHRDWAPAGADRFYNLVKNGFFTNVRFFRAVPNFMVQFGIHGDPAVASQWRNARLPVDKVVKSNTRGMVTYAMGGTPDTRTTQMFINYKDNSFLDKMGFAPFGEVTKGMESVDKIYTGYGDGPPKGQGPDQGRLQSEGNAYLMKDFPKMDYIKAATIGK